MIQCINTHLKGVELLIGHRADVNITDGLHNTALILACRHCKDDEKEECSEMRPTCRKGRQHDIDVRVYFRNLWS